MDPNHWQPVVVALQSMLFVSWSQRRTQYVPVHRQRDESQDEIDVAAAHLGAHVPTHSHSQVEPHDTASGNIAQATEQRSPVHVHVERAHSAELAAW